MTRDRFEQILEMLEGKFEVTNRRKEELHDGSGGSTELIEFQGPLGKMKLEFTEKPRLKGESTNYSRRIGGEVTVKKEYDPEDMVSFMKAFKWDEPANEWIEIEAGKLAEV